MKTPRTNKTREQPKRTSNVVPIGIREHNATIETLECLLRGTKEGRIVGLAVAWRCRNGNYGNATTGYYKTDRIAALGAASKLWAQINDAHDRGE